MKKLFSIILICLLIPLSSCKKPEDNSEDQIREYNQTYHWVKKDGQIVEGSNELHSYDEWNVVTEPTCTSFGTKERTCIVCGHTETEKIEKVAHHYDDWKIVTEPTCIKTGEKKKICTLCGHTETEEIEKCDHQSSEWIVNYNASYARSGEKRKYCTVCGKELELEVIPRVPLEDPMLEMENYEVVRKSYSQQDGVEYPKTPFSPFPFYVLPGPNHLLMKLKLVERIGSQSSDLWKVEIKEIYSCEVPYTGFSIRGTGPQYATLEELPIDLTITIASRDTENECLESDYIIMRTTANIRYTGMWDEEPFLYEPSYVKRECYNYIDFPTISNAGTILLGTIEHKFSNTDNEKSYSYYPFKNENDNGNGNIEYEYFNYYSVKDGIVNIYNRGKDRTKTRTDLDQYAYYIYHSLKDEMTIQEFDDWVYTVFRRQKERINDPTRTSNRCY